jgi:uncharacterized protein (TIGR02145 family)
MNKKIKIATRVALFGLIPFLISSCNKEDTIAETEIQINVIECNTNTTVIDGYETVKIGSQIWMKKNMNTPIGTHVTDDQAWFDIADDDTTGAWCYYNNDSKYSDTYGALYTYAAALKVCPNGWHLPSLQDWSVLLETLDTETFGVSSLKAGGILKEEGTGHWLSPNTGATNDYCFTALPGGYRHDSQSGFNSLETQGYWWTPNTPSSSAHAKISAYAVTMGNTHTEFTQTAPQAKSRGYSCRCIKD